ncbi:MAG: hypothetical protein QF554_01695 [Dehalococcoidia bacterium]|jgi:dipeptidase|nr:hypothetical protein [Dehalococcoidia bacterium]
MNDSGVAPDPDHEDVSDLYSGCDTMVSTGASSSDGATLFAKNSDRPADDAQPLESHAATQAAVPGTQFVKIGGAAPAYRHVGSRPDWCWGYEHGFNEHQVVIGNEALPSLLPESDEPRLVGMEVLRLALERGATAEEAVNVITGLVAEYGQGKFSNDAGVRTYDNIYMVADPGEAYVVETVGHEWAVRPVSGVHSISNVSGMDEAAQLSPGAEAQAIRHGLFDPANGRAFAWSDVYSAVADARSGARRQSRSSSILTHHEGEIDFGKLMLTLSDHGSPGGDPSRFEPVPGDLRGICTHPQHEGGATAASLVADLCADGSRLPVYWCAMYAPCMALFFPVFIEGELPEALSIGGGVYSDDSPWWMFHALGQEGFAGGYGRMKEIHEGWWDLQKNMFSSAYDIAVRGRAMIDAGDSGAASEMLTRYMRDNAESMLNVGREMLNAGTFRAVRAR